MVFSIQPDGYLAVPPAGEGPGVLVLHAWWGLNDSVKAFCRRLADAGFVAFAPDLYHGKIAKTITEAEDLAHALNRGHVRAEAELTEAAMYLSELPGQTAKGLAVTGFSLGANYALDLAVALPAMIRSVVLFYGTGGGDFSTSQAEYLGHFAGDDPYEPKEGVTELEQALKDAGRPVTFHTYPGTSHWFFEPDRAEAYNEAAASLAWDRTLEFLRDSATG
jgi:carboxymethylenebutenolidase